MGVPVGQTPRPATDSAIVIGQVFLGKYRVDSVLGQGGMGVVAKCTHLGLNEHVAIKMLRQDVMLDRDATERFQREAQLASKLKSEHVARVVDVGTFPETGVPYMVMEFLDGHDLGELVDERGPLQAPFAAMLMLQAAEALGEAHSIGIVHRDVKPSNLFVTWRPDGSALVKVLDFGISKATLGTDLRLTQTQSLLGTPAYMSPEQMRSARLVDARTDIWSLGTVFYELLEARRPFEAESFSEMCVMVAVDPPAEMVNTPPALQPIILRCLAKNPDQRYANMAELGRDLLPHVQDVHQASLLVERMQNLADRGVRASGANVDQWDGPTTGVTRAPILIRDPGRAATPLPFNSVDLTPDPRAPNLTMREDSRPARALSEVITVKPPKQRRKLVALVALVALLTLLGVGALAATGAFSSENKVVAPIAVEGVKDPIAKQPDPVVKSEDKPAIDKPVVDDKAGSAEIKDAITIEPDVAIEKPVTKAIKPNKPNKLPAGRPNIKKPLQSKPVGDGSAKTVVEPHVIVKPPELPTVPLCKVYERLPSGACPQTVPQKP